jgi:hypothetical protein
MCDLEFKKAAVRQLPRGEKVTIGFAHIVSMVAYFAMPAMFQVVLNILPRFAGYTSTLCFLKTMAIRALIAAWNLAALSRCCALKTSCHG